jgi:peptide/nickel transport system permease protein
MSQALDVPAVGYPEDQESLKVEVASQWQLMWWKFRKHKLAMLGGAIVLLFYFVALFCEFFAPTVTTWYSRDYVNAPPQRVRLLLDGKWFPHISGYTFTRDPRSFKKTWSIDESVVIPFGLFVRGQPYKMWGFIPGNVHLIGPKNLEDPFYLLGSDKNGRDVCSRLIYSARISLTVGLIGVALSLSLGSLG